MEEINESSQPIVAYLSMEIALDSELNIYAGGLGVLAGDLLRAAASGEVPLVGVTLLNRQGYSRQKIVAGEPVSEADNFPLDRLKLMEPIVTIAIGQEQVKVCAWRYYLRSGGQEAPVYLLDTDLAGNSPAVRALCGQLYGGDEEYRLKQEIVLGRASVKMLHALGYENIKKIHINEGHGSLAAVETFLNSSGADDKARLAATRRQCVFTTHTPVAKGHDIFSLPYFLEYQPDFPIRLAELTANNEVNLTKVGFYLSGYINAVSKQHRRTVKQMFPGYEIRSITNGVDSGFWTAPDFQALYDCYLPGWRRDGRKLKKAKAIPAAEIRAAHFRAKDRLISELNRQSGTQFSSDVFTIVFARRFATYKRPEFLLADMERLREISRRVGKIQIIYAGKEHPRDLEGRELVKLVLRKQKEAAGEPAIVFWENYNLEMAKLLVAGADLWLSNPVPPNEASGTSGMKAAHNGVPQACTNDGWWPEGYRRGETGWLIEDDSQKLYDLLEKEIMPLYYSRPEEWSKLMRSTISRNASFFNADRALDQYLHEAYDDAIRRVEKVL